MHVKRLARHTREHIGIYPAIVQALQPYDAYSVYQFMAYRVPVWRQVVFWMLKASIYMYKQVYHEWCFVIHSKILTHSDPPILNRTSRIPCSENVKLTLKIERLHSKIEILCSEHVIFTVKNCNGALNRLPGFLCSRNGNSVLKMAILFEILC